MSAALPAVTPILSRDIVAASLEHLSRITLPGGRFIYAHEAGDTDQRHDGYNLLRHCGTLWFMARAVNESGAAAGLALASWPCRKWAGSPPLTAG